MTAPMTTNQSAPRELADWQWVPKEPTDDMLFAAAANYKRPEMFFTALRRTYRLMLAAAPTPETPRTTDEAVRATWSSKGMMPSPTGEWTPVRTMAAQPAADALTTWQGKNVLRDLVAWGNSTDSNHKPSLVHMIAEAERVLAASPAAPVAQADAQDAARTKSLVTALQGFITAIEYGITPDAGQMDFARAAIAAQADGAKA